MTKGFTLIEIMIVVLIIGVLLAIAAPSFVQAREASRAKSCVQNLREIDSAKQRWAMDARAAVGDQPDWTDLVPAYMKPVAHCASTTTDYQINSVGTLPTCPIGTTPGANYQHVLY